MDRHSQQSELIHRYLLGQLSEEDNERLESTYFEQTAVFLDLLEAKEELINRYLRGALPPEEHRLFEQRFFTSASLRREVEIQRLAQNFSSSNLNKETGSAPGGSGFPGWRAWLRAPADSGKLSWVVAVLVLSAAGMGLLLLLRGTSPVEPVEKAAGSRPPAEMPARSTPSSSAGNPVVREIELESSAAERSGGKGNYKLDMDSSVSHARVKLRLTGKIYRAYHADLVKKDAGMRIVSSNDSLKPEGNSNQPYVLWTFEATQLPNGDYLFDLQGIHEKGERAPAGAYDLSVRWR